MLEFLAPYADIWEVLGKGLKVRADVINGLRGQDAGIIKLSKVIEEWQNSLSKEPITWGTLIDVLNSKIVNLGKAADAVKNFLRGDGGKEYIK